MNNDEKMLENNTYYINIVHINRGSVKLFRNAAEKFYKEKVTLQYPHSYRQKSMQDRLWRWDFCLAVVHFLTVSAVHAQTY